MWYRLWRQELTLFAYRCSIILPSPRVSPLLLHSNFIESCQCAHLRSQSLSLSCPSGYWCGEGTISSTVQGFSVLPSLSLAGGRIMQGETQGHSRQYEKPKSESSRSLTIFSWSGNVPTSAVCTCCNRVFRVPLAAMIQVSTAEQSLNQQFARHRCKVISQ